MSAKVNERYDVCAWCGEGVRGEGWLSGYEVGTWKHRTCDEEIRELDRRRNKPIVPPVKEGGSTTWKVVCRFCGSEDTGSEVVIFSPTVRHLVGFMNCNGCGKGQHLGQPEILEIVETEEGRVG